MVACIILGTTAAARWWPRIADHAISTDNYTDFISDLAGLFSGVTVYEYISGTLGLNARDAIGALTIEIALTFVTTFIVGLVAWAYYRRIRRGRSTLDLALVTAWISCVGAFFLVAGPEAIRPHFERYAICLIAPTIALSARGLHWWMQPSTRFSFATAPLLIVLAWASLFVFKRQYFDEFAMHGGNSHRTFRHGAAEPKQAALALILERSPTDRPVRISTSEWWLYWPLRYLAYAHDHVPGRACETAKTRDRSTNSGLPDREHWIVEFAEEQAGWRLKRSLDKHGREQPDQVERHTIYDPDQRPILCAVPTDRAKPLVGDDTPQRAHQAASTDNRSPAPSRATELAHSLLCHGLSTTTAYCRPRTACSNGSKLRCPDENNSDSAYQS